VRGENVMLGYYKNEDATNAVFDKEGWLHTGDVGITDPDGTIYIRGRSKTMILTANGQNIYPEEIEAKLNALTGVLESLVYEQGGRMTALVVADPDFVRTNKLSPSDVKELMQANLAKLNTLVAPYEKVSEIKVCTEEFAKTPKRSIRRYLYPDAAKLAE
jgi:long-chain acyl-CoA synthetase